MIENQNLILTLIILLGFILMYYFLNYKLEKGLNNKEFLKYNKFKIFNFEGNDLKKIRSLVKIRNKFNYSLNNYYIIAIRNNIIIDLSFIKEKKKYKNKIISFLEKYIHKEHKVISKYNNFEFLIYEVPKKYFFFNNLLTFFQYKSYILFIKKNSRFFLFSFFLILTFILLCYANYSNSSIGLITGDYDLYIKKINIMFVDTIIVIFCSEYFILFLTVILVLAISIMTNYIYSLLFFVYPVCIFFICLSFFFLYMYQPLSFILKLNQPNNPFIGLNSNYLIKYAKNKIKNYEKINIEGKTVFKISYDEKFIYYQDFKKNEKNFLINKQKKLHNDFKDTNCGKFFHNIRENCKDRNILKCEKEDMLLSLFITNKFFNSSNTERIPLLLVPYKKISLNGEKININNDIDFENLINKCKFIKKTYS